MQARAQGERPGVAEALLKAHPLPLLVVRDGTLRQANRAAVRDLGASLASELVGRPLDDCLHLDDTARVASLLGDDVPRPGLEGPDVLRGARLLRIDGTLQPVDLRLQWVDLGDDDGPSLLLSWTDREESDRLLSALQRTSQRLADTQRAAGIGSWEWDLLSGEAWWSDAFYRVLGVEPGTLAPGYTAFLDLVHDDDRALLRAAFRRAFRGEDPLHAEFRLGANADRPRRLLARARLVRDGAGRPLRLVGTTLDVTETRALEEQLQQSQKMEAMGALAGGVAHDFNNLLSVVLGNAELALARLPEGSDLDLELREIRGAAERAAELTSQLLAFGRRQALEARVLDLREVVHETCRVLRRVLREDVSLEVRVTDEACHVRVDPVKIEQILLNLAINAQDAMPHGGGLLIETVRRRAPSRGAPTVEVGDTWPLDKNALRCADEVLMRVSDTGHGMDQATLARVFDPFFTTKERGRGTGLGLSTVYGIVRQHRGRITVRSRPDVGTRFEIVLPAHEEALREPTPARVIVRPPAAGVTVLVVEDDAMVRRVLATLLAASGFRVVMAERPQEAIDVVRQGAKVDVLLTDVVLPDMTGRGLHAALAEVVPGLPVVFMSGYTADVVAEQGVLDDGASFLQKPFGSDRLVSMVCEVLARRV
ncbi:MAG: response regulator [Planctomycetes bacterium]|nr:response regulator [Planctomycetota bacterium]